jgi:hypothetical protein
MTEASMAVTAAAIVFSILMLMGALNGVCCGLAGIRDSATRRAALRDVQTNEADSTDDAVRETQSADQPLTRTTDQPLTRTPMIIGAVAAAGVVGYLAFKSSGKERKWGKMELASVCRSFHAAITDPQSVRAGSFNTVGRLENLPLPPQVFATIIRDHLLGLSKKSPQLIADQTDEADSTHGTVPETQSATQTNAAHFVRDAAINMGLFLVEHALLNTQR